MTARDDARAVLAEAMRAGLELSAEGAGLRVKPAERLTAELHAVLKLHKPELLELLRAESTLGAAGSALDANEQAPRAHASNGAPSGDGDAAARPGSAPPWPRGPQHCVTCWGTRFVDLHDGRRWACFTCAAPDPGDVVAECANGPERPERTRAGARVAEERAAGVRAADGATRSQVFCESGGGDVPNRPNGAEADTHEFQD